MPTKTHLKIQYFIKNDNTATGFEPIGIVTDHVETFSCEQDLPEEILIYLEEDVRATNEAYMRIHNTIKKVIFSGLATVVIWMDGTKTIVKCTKGDTYDPEKGLMMCIMERFLGGSKMEVKRFFKKWIPEDTNDVELDFDLERSVKTIVEGAKKVLEDNFGGV